MWIDEDQHEPDDERLPEKYERERQLARKQTKLAKLLCSQGPSEPETEIETQQLVAARRLARAMLHARELLDACEYAVTLLGGLSTDQFAAGGDRPARERLQRAIMDGCDGFNSQALMRQCDEDVRRAILANQSRA